MWQNNNKINRGGGHRSKTTSKARGVSKAEPTQEKDRKNKSPRIARTKQREQLRHTGRQRLGPTEVKHKARGKHQKGEEPQKSIHSREETEERGGEKGREEGRADHKEK